MFLFCHLQFAFAFHDRESLQNSSSERGQELAITGHASFLYVELKVTEFNPFSRANN